MRKLLSFLQENLPTKAGSRTEYDKEEVDQFLDKLGVFSEKVGAIRVATHEMVDELITISGRDPEEAHNNPEAWTKLDERLDLTTSWVLDDLHQLAEDVLDVVDGKTDEE